MEQRKRHRSPGKLQLPTGVGLEQWELEKAQFQNPRIKALLICVKLLDEVLESNYAILHCSPRRVQEVWTNVLKTSAILRDTFAPLIEVQSALPQLDEACRTSEMFLTILEEEVLVELNRFPADIPADRLEEVRKLLCVASGQMQTFLQDTLGVLMAADPRSQHDADYFLSRRFAHDVDESRWLQASVLELEQYLQTLADAPDHLAAAIRAVAEEKAVPSNSQWEPVASLLDELIEGVSPYLRRVLGLRGIRLGEMEHLEHHATELPTLSRILIELYRAAVAATSGLAAENEEAAELERALQERNHVILSYQLVRLMRGVEAQLRDLLSFVAIWRQGIQHRRALSWASEDETEQAP